MMGAFSIITEEEDRERPDCDNRATWPANARGRSPLIDPTMTAENPTNTPAADETLVPVHVRPARLEELSAIEEFLQPFVVERRILPRTTDELSTLLANAFIATQGEEVVGFAALEIYSRKLGEIRSLCVSASLQGRGIGKQLTQACVELAKEKNVFEVMVITSSEAFFKSCGFDFTLPGEKKALFLQTRDDP